MTDYYKLSTILWMAFFIFVLQGCAVLSEPAYEGQIIDIETKEPIAGASVVAIYMSEVMTPVQSTTSTVEVRGAVTDKEGKFLTLNTPET